MGFAKRSKKCIQAEGGAFKDRDLLGVEVSVMSVESQPGDEEDEAASSGAIEWM